MSFSRTHLIPPVPQILTVYKLRIKVVPTDYQFPHLQKSHAWLSTQTQDCCHLRYRWSEYRQPLGWEWRPCQHNLKTCNSEDGDEIQRPKELRGHED